MAYVMEGSLTQMRYANAILNIVDDAIDDGSYITFYVPKKKVPTFLRILKDEGKQVEKL